MNADHKHEFSIYIHTAGYKHDEYYTHMFLRHIITVHLLEKSILLRHFLILNYIRNTSMKLGFIKSKTPTPFLLNMATATVY
jgi:hypothetical protein